MLHVDSVSLCIFCMKHERWAYVKWMKAFSPEICIPNLVAKKWLIQFKDSFFIMIDFHLPARCRENGMKIAAKH